MVAFASHLQVEILDITMKRKILDITMELKILDITMDYGDFAKYLT